MDKLHDEWMAGWLAGWMGGRMDGWMDGWLDGWTDGCSHEGADYACADDCMSAGSERNRRELTAGGCNPLASAGPGRKWGRQWCDSLSATPETPCHAARPAQRKCAVIIQACIFQTCSGAGMEGGSLRDWLEAGSGSQLILMPRLPFM